MGKDDFTKCPNGAGGVEERLSLLYSEGVAKGRITINQLVDKLSTTPAKVYGLAPDKGLINIGADADIVIYNPNNSHTLSHDLMHGSCDYTAYEGQNIQGDIEYVIQRGKIIGKDGKFLGTEGDGKFIHRKGFNSV